MPNILLETNDIRFNFVNIKKGSSIILYSKFNIDVLVMDGIEMVNEFKYLDSIVIYAGFDYYDNDVHCHIRYGLKSVYDDKYSKEEFVVKLPANLFHYDFGEAYRITEIMRSIFINALRKVSLINNIEEEEWLKLAARYVYYDQVIALIIDKICNNSSELISLEKDK